MVTPLMSSCLPSAQTLPLLPALIAWGLLGEVMPPIGWVGFALAALGVTIAVRKSVPVLQSGPPPSK